MKQVIKGLLSESLLRRFRFFKFKHFPSAEAKSVDEKRKAFYAQFVKAGDLVFDVGANMGNRVGPLLSLGARVVAIEPQDYCVKFLRYKYGNEITVVQKGVGASEGFLDLHLADFNTLSSFSPDWIEKAKNHRFHNVNWNKTIRVEITTLDRLIETFGPPSFIKIDVEGFEPEVLKGLHHTVKVISFEYLQPEMRDNLLTCLALLSNNVSVECNYSEGESMQFALPDWMPFDEFSKHIQTTAFQRTCGDIYVRRP